MPRAFTPRNDERAAWLTAAEIAAAGLPGVPDSLRRVNELATAEGWRERLDTAGRPLARKRKGRGGGWEYHVSLLPAAARAALEGRGEGRPATAALLERGADTEALRQAPLRQAQGEDSKPDVAGAWAQWDHLTDRARAEAQRRAAILAEVEGHERAGRSRPWAIETVVAARRAAGESLSVATVYNWFQLCRGAEKHERLALLAPATAPGGRTAEVDEDLWQLWLADYLRPEQPAASACHRRVARIARERGLAAPPLKTLQRKLSREIAPTTVTLLRQGREALAALRPTQQRDRRHLSALEWVCIDGHRFDDWCLWPGLMRPMRPTLVALQDLASSTIVAWRVGWSESAEFVRLVFGDLFRDWGVPDHALLDNGRGFASKWITGGAPSRYRFKIKPEDPTGLLTGLGIQTHWALPYRGRSKPIERAFRDLCEDIAKHPALSGAYTGNRPTNKPSNYGERAIPVEAFRDLVGEMIAEHNARKGRRTLACGGVLSFDDVFAASYATAPIRRLTEEQLRLCLLAGEQITVRRDGSLVLWGNRYWGEALAGWIGRKLTVRYDPDDLSQPLQVYEPGGRWLCAAECIGLTAFDDAEAAKDTLRREREWARKHKALAAAEVRLGPADVAAALAGASAPAETPRASTGSARGGISRPVFGLPRAARPPRDDEAEGETVIDILARAARGAA